MMRARNIGAAIAVGAGGLVMAAPTAHAEPSEGPNCERMWAAAESWYEGWAIAVFIDFDFAAAERALGYAEALVDKAHDAGC